jgi:hypothetical protein
MHVTNGRTRRTDAEGATVIVQVCTASGVTPLLARTVAL